MMEIEIIVISICIICNIAAYYVDLFYNFKKGDEDE
jgi:hypothetical protein